MASAVGGGGDLVGGVVAVAAGGGGAVGEGFDSAAAGGVDDVAVAGNGGAAFEVGIAEELAGGVVALAFGDAVFVNEGGVAAGFVVGVGGEVRWRWKIGIEGLELGAGGVGVRYRRDACAPFQVAAQAVGIVVVRDDAGRAGGEGLRFRGQEVVRVVGIVAF